MRVYDYDKQEWANGSEAMSIRKTQIKRELSILESKAAEDYLRLIGVGQPLDRLTRDLKAELLSLNLAHPSKDGLIDIIS